jgi:hypothetical protein
MNVHPSLARSGGPIPARPGLPTPPWLALTLAVLALHATLLQFAPAAFSFGNPMRPRHFIARGFVLPPPGVAAVPLPEIRVDAVSNSISHARAVRPPVPRDAPVSTSRVDAAAAFPPEPAQTNPPADAGTGTGSAQAAAPSAAVAIGNSAAQSPGALLIPGSMRLTYRVAAENRGLPLSTSAELLWQHDGHHYEARFTADGLPRTRVLTSRGAFDGLGLMPTRFADKSGSERAAHFERAAEGQGGQVVFSANSPTVALAPGAQDRLSVLLQLGAMLAGDPARYGAGSSIGLQVIGAREAEVWVFQVEGYQALDLPQGSTRSVKLTRHPRREFDQKVEVWFGEAMGYLPVRIRITEPNGNFQDQTLEKLSTP